MRILSCAPLYTHRVKSVNHYLTTKQLERSVVVYDFEGLPKRFMEARKNKDVSREILGKFVGNSRQAVARWEQPVGHERHSVPDLPTIAQVATYLGVDFLWLLTGKNFNEAVNEGGGDLVPVFGIQELHAKA